MATFKIENAHFWIDAATAEEAVDLFVERVERGFGTNNSDYDLMDVSAELWEPDEPVFAVGDKVRLAVKQLAGTIEAVLDDGCYMVDFGPGIAHWSYHESDLERAE